MGPFLVARACANPVIANYLYWSVVATHNVCDCIVKSIVIFRYVTVEAEDKDSRIAEIYTALSRSLLLALNQVIHVDRMYSNKVYILVAPLQGDSTSRQSRLMLKRQTTLVDQLVAVSNRLSGSNQNRLKRAC